MSITAPTDRSNCVLWLRARDHASLGSPSDGGNPTKWDDLSGSAFNQSVSGGPTYQANSGIPYVNLDGSDDYFFRNADLGLYAAGAASVFLAIRGNPGTDRRLVASGSSSSNTPVYAPVCSQATTASTLATWIRDTTGTGPFIEAVGGGCKTVQASVWDNTDKVVGIVDTGSLITPWVGGSEGTGISYTRGGGTLVSDRFSFGAMLRGAASAFFAGRIYEMACYTKALNDTEAGDLSTYLAAAFAATPSNIASPFVGVLGRPLSGLMGR